MKDEVAQMIRDWFSLGDLPGSDDYDASDLVEKIVLGYESLGEYRAADIYRAMIAREKAHDWGDRDDVLVVRSDEQGVVSVGMVPFSEAFNTPSEEDGGDSPHETAEDSAKDLTTDDEADEHPF